MNDLGPEVSALLQAARDAEAPTRADRARIKHAVILRVATVGAASTVASGAVAMTLATKVTVAALAVAVLGGGSVSLWALKERRAPPSVAPQRTASRHTVSRPALPTQPMVEPAAPVEAPRPKALPPEARRREVARREPQAVAPSAAGQQSAPVLQPVGPGVSGEPSTPVLADDTPGRQGAITEPSRPHGTEDQGSRPGWIASQNLTEILTGGTRPKISTAGLSRGPVVEPAPAPVATVDSLNPELTVLRQAQEDLHAGLPARALRRLAEYDRRFGKGTLNEERRAIGAIALCQAQPGPAAQTQAQRFLHDVPQSPLAGRVRSACQKSDETAK